MSGKVFKKLRLKALNIWEQMPKHDKDRLKSCRNVYKLVKKDYKLGGKV